MSIVAINQLRGTLTEVNRSLRESEPELKARVHTLEHVREQLDRQLLLWDTDKDKFETAVQAAKARVLSKGAEQ